MKASNIPLHSSSYWTTVVMWVTVAEEFRLEVIPSRIICIWFLSFVFFEKPAAVQRTRFLGKRAHVKIQVQGREDERCTSWACEAKCEIVVCQ